MSHLSKLLVVIGIVVVGNYLVVSYLPPVPGMVGDRLLSIFPPIWENSLNVNEVSFGWITSIFLILLIFFAINLKKVETKNPFINDFYILLLSIGFIIDGTFLISMLFVTFYVVYVFWECIDGDYSLTIPVAFFAITLFSFSAFVIRYRDTSPDLIVEVSIFLVSLLLIRFVRQYYSNNKEGIKVG